MKSNAEQKKLNNEIIVEAGNLGKVLASFISLSKTKRAGLTSYRIARLLAKLRDEYQVYLQEHDKVVYEYAAVKDENGKPILNEKGNVTIDPSRVEEYQAKIKEMNLVKIKFEFEKLKIEEIGEVEAEVLEAILDFIKE